MNYNTRHSSDEMIERELEGLRQPGTSSYGLGDAILAMQAKPKTGRTRLTWPVGLGTVAVVGGAIVLVGSLTPGRAYAGEIQAIASAQNRQPIKYMKAYLFGGEKEPVMVREHWNEGRKEAYRQFDQDGRMAVAFVSDGVREHRYFTGAGGMNPLAQIDEDWSDEFGIDTIDSLLNSKFFRERKIEKKSGVKLNGRTCDYYSFADGYYRVWVDPATRLPLQREIYDRGVTLFERDVYEYPASFPASTFTPVEPKGMEYFDYIAARQKLREMLAKPGQSQRVGDVTITFKGLLKESHYVYAIWSTSGVDSDAPSLDISEAWPHQSPSTLSTESVAPGQKLIIRGVQYGDPFKLPTTVRIAAWDAKKAGQPVGWATFAATDAFTVPFCGQLLRRPSNEIMKASTAKNN